MICLILLFYLIGAVIFWSSHKSESLMRDLLLGLAWPVVVPVNVVLAALEEWRTEHTKAQADREAELREREERFIGYGGESTAKWMIEEAAEGEDEKEER